MVTVVFIMDLKTCLVLGCVTLVCAQAGEPEKEDNSTENDLVCKRSTNQSPVHIPKDCVTASKKNWHVTVHTEGGLGHHGLHLAILHAHVIGVPDYLTYIDSKTWGINYDLYVVQFYPKPLHTVEGMDPPVFEVNMKFVKDKPIDRECPRFNTEDLISAARMNKLISVVQMVSQLQAHEVYNKHVETFIHCILKLTDQHNITCKVLMHDILDISGGSYHYDGSLMHPICEEKVTYLILNNSMKISAEHIDLIKKLMPRFESRPQQPLNGRKVWFASHMGNSLATTPWLSVSWILVLVVVGCIS